MSLPSPPIVAHRGFAAEYTENTITAFHAASEVADAIELDIRRCATGEPVVFHDESLDRLTDASGPVSVATFDTLRGLDVAGTGETVPTPAEVFETIPDTVDLYIHLKDPGVAEPVRWIHTAGGHGHDIVFTSEDPAVLLELPPSETLAYTIRDVDGDALDELIELAQAVGVDEIHPRYPLCVETDIVTRAHDAGLGVVAWTIRSDRDFAAVRGTGVDAVHTDIIP